jgi:hypothetical protein
MMQAAADADIIHTGFTTHIPFVQLLAATRNYAKLALGKDLPIIVDCDDDLLHVPSYNTSFNAYTGSAESRRVALFSLRLGDGVSVSTSPLVPLYDDFNYHISHLPNCVDPADWESGIVDPRRASSSDVRIVFAGGIGRKADLDSIRPALESVMRQRPAVRLFFMAMMPDWVAEQWALDPVNPAANRAFFISPTDITTYRRVMTWIGPDICIAPVVSNEFNAAKSSIKVLESPFYGAASVCSDFETYAEVPAEATMKAETTYEWTESLLALVDDPELRKKKVATCKQWALDCKHIDQHVSKWVDCYEAARARQVIDSDGNGMKEQSRIIRPG